MASGTKPITLKDFQGSVPVATAALQKLAKDSPESLESLFKKFSVEKDSQTLILTELSVEVVEISNLKLELAKAIDAKKQLEEENICLQERGSKAGGAKVSKAGGSKAGGSKPSSDEEILQGLGELADELETGEEMLLSDVGVFLIRKGIKGVKRRLKNLILQDNSRFEIVNDGVRGLEMVKRPQ